MGDGVRGRAARRPADVAVAHGDGGQGAPDRGLVPVTLTDGQVLPLPALPLDGKRPPLRRDLPAAGQHNSEIMGEIMAELGWGGGRGSD